MYLFPHLIHALKFRQIIFDYFISFAQNIDCGYPQSMFWSKNKKTGMPLHTTPVLLYELEYKGVFISRFPDVKLNN